MAIEFQADEMMSFYFMWQEALSAYGSPQLDTYLKSFQNPDIEAIKNSYPKGIGGKIQNLSLLGKDIQNGEVRNIDEFAQKMAKHLDVSKEDMARISPNLQKAFGAYHDFYKTAEPIISSNLTTLNDVQTDKQLGYSGDLSKLYKFFGVDEKSDRLVGYVNPSPVAPLYDGMCTNSGFYQNFPSHQLSGKSYVGDSTVGENKISTPLHEATHHIFARSQIKKDIINGEAKGRIKEVINVMDEYIKACPQGQVRGAKGLSALDEAFAACSSALMDEKRTGVSPLDNPDREWYHGFDAANRLAPKVYPLYREYLEQGKTLDGEFFGKLGARLGDIKIATNKAQRQTAQEDITPTKEQHSQAPQSKMSVVEMTKITQKTY